MKEALPVVTLFYATNNKSKLHNMRYRLRDYPIKVVCPDDMGMHMEVEENGKTAVENALLKARAYYDVVCYPVVAGDSGVYIDGLADEEQPGLYARRYNGTVLSDDEMIERYIDIAKKIGHPTYLRYITGIAMINESEEHTMELCDTPLTLTATPNSNRKHRGNPLDVVTLTEDGRYFNELSDTERIALDKAGEQSFTDFVVKHLFT